MASPTTTTAAATATPTPSTYDPQRSAAAIAIQKARGLSVAAIPQPGGGVRFRPERGGRAFDAMDYETPVEALEAAEATLSAADARANELSAARHLENLGRAVYAPWPEVVRGTGATAGQIEWQVRRVADNSVLSRWEGLTPALVEIGRLLAEDDAAKGGSR